MTSSGTSSVAGLPDIMRSITSPPCTLLEPTPNLTPHYITPSPCQDKPIARIKEPPCFRPGGYPLLALKRNVFSKKPGDFPCLSSTRISLNPALRDFKAGYSLPLSLGQTHDIQLLLSLLRPPYLGILFLEMRGITLANRANLPAPFLHELDNQLLGRFLHPFIAGFQNGHGHR